MECDHTLFYKLITVGVLLHSAASSSQLIVWAPSGAPAGMVAAHESSLMFSLMLGAGKKLMAAVLLLSRANLF